MMLCKGTLGPSGMVTTETRRVAITTWHTRPGMRLPSSFMLLQEREQMTVLTDTKATFTKSNGTVFSKIYERLTKASRRRGHTTVERAYRKGIYDTLKALNEEIDELI